MQYLEKKRKSSKNVILGKRTLFNGIKKQEITFRWKKRVTREPRG